MRCSGGPDAARSRMDLGREEVLWPGEHGVRLQSQRSEGGGTSHTETAGEEGQTVQECQHASHEHARQSRGTGPTFGVTDLSSFDVLRTY